MIPNYVIQDSELAGGIQQTEKFISSLVAHQSHQLILDFQHIPFIRPYGLLALWKVARQRAQKHMNSIHFTNISDNVLAYLDRIGFLSQVGSWIQVRELSVGATWSKSIQPNNLLEMTSISAEEDVFIAMERLQHICKQMNIPNTNTLLNVISELCSNIHEHSGDENGCAFVQRHKSLKYGWQKMSVVVGDMGMGIEQSLQIHANEIGKKPIDYLHAALNGTTSRLTGHGGMGLQTVQELAVSNEGLLWLRSGKSGVLIKPESTQSFDNLSLVEGTQLLVELRTTL